MYNILINNLSTVRSNVTEESRYQLNTGEDTGLSGEDRLFKGVYTNEPITHALIRKFAVENQGEKLDLIYSLTTDSVQQKKVCSVCRDQKEKDCRAFYARYLKMEQNELQELSHYEFYKKLIQKILEEENGRISGERSGEMDLQPKMDFWQLPDRPDTRETHAAVLEMAKTVIRLYEEHQGQCRLFMDYTGGDRTVSTVIIALTKMLEERGIHIDHIWAVVSFNQNAVNEIAEKIEVNYIFDLISGLQEFNRYGRADILNDFLRKSEEKESIVLSRQARKVQQKIQNLADKIQLCSAGDMVRAIGELVNAIADYEKNDTANDQVFNYLIADIKNNYAKIYEKDVRTIPNIINWCLDKNMIQQAVTMYAELLPEVLVKEKILYYDRSGWNQVDTRQSGTDIYKNEVQNYICYGTRNVAEAIRANRSSKKNYNNYKEEYAYINYYVWQEVDKMAELAGYGTDISGKVGISEKKADRITEYIFSGHSPYTQVKAGLRKKDLKDLLKNYMAFKTEIRHSLNHAAGKFPLKKIQSSIIWTDTRTMSRAFSENSGMTTELLAQIIRDLLEQLNHILEL